MNSARRKFLKLIKERSAKYCPAKKSVIERKIDKMLAHDHVLIESVQGITSVINVPYALIGGHAVTIHGTPRMTEDIDILTMPQYVDDIVKSLNIKVESPITIGGVAGKTISGMEIDVIAPSDQAWVEDAIDNSEGTKYGKVVSKPYLVLTKIFASRGTQDDADIINILNNMNETQQNKTAELVKEYFPSMYDDIMQMIEIANLGIKL